ncbi:MAG: hypothetical protein LBT05_06730 [Planctomycetaceae bacterium]|jgi:hypothetical protein|nr:hypothetical protein [Planctomycetaceae bacterium]
MSLSSGDYFQCHAKSLHTHYHITEGRPIPCEFCLKHGKTAFLDSVLLSPPETFWYFCRTCGFAGTGIDYLARLERKTASQFLQQNAGDRISEKTLSLLTSFESKQNRLYQKYREAPLFRKDLSRQLFF